MKRGAQGQLPENDNKYQREEGTKFPFEVLAVNNDATETLVLDEKFSAALKEDRDCATSIRSETYFNELRHAVKYNMLEKITSIKEKLSRVEFVSLLNMGNKHSHEAAIIHYAAKYNKPDAIQTLVGDLELQQQLQIFKIPLPGSKCTSLHFSANEESFEAACAIKKILYSVDNHNAWLELLQTTQCDDENPAHYAARHTSSKFLQLFSEGLTEDEWFSIISKKYKQGHNVVAVCFINQICDRRLHENAYRSFVKDLRYKLNADLWCQLLMAESNRKERTIDIILNDFSHDANFKRNFIGEICRGLSQEQIELLNIVDTIEERTTVVTGISAIDMKNTSAAITPALKLASDIDVVTLNVDLNPPQRKIDVKC